MRCGSVQPAGASQTSCSGLWHCTVSLVSASVMCSLSTVVCGVVLCLASAVQCQRYIVPEATLQFLSPRGLKISIPDIDKDVTLVAFHININEEFYALEHGQWAQDLIKKREGRWTYIIQDFKVKKGDTIYYWIYVIVDGLGYQGLDRSYKVTEDNPHGQGGGGTPRPPGPTTPTPPRPSFTPDLVTQGPTICRPSLSTRNNGQEVCREAVIFNKNFNDLGGWKHEVHIGGNLDDEFTIFSQRTDISAARNGKLVIRPALTEDKHEGHEEFVNSGHLQLEGCTSSDKKLCEKEAYSFNILPPIMSARLTTKDNFSFRYGTVEIRAKMPRGDWIVPELWLEPVSQWYGDRSGRVVLGLARGNLGSQFSGQLLEAGAVINSTRKYMGQLTKGYPWSQGYYTYKLTWTPDKMEFSVDGETLTQLPVGNDFLDSSLNGGKLAPFDKEFYITLGVHVAGVLDFPDTIPNKPWTNTETKRYVKFWENKDTWKRSWNDESALFVESVKVTAL